MKKLSKLKTFADFKAEQGKPEVSSAVKESRSVVTQQRLAKVNESAFKVGDDYKVKVTLDIPTSLIKDYIAKVKEETGKNALDNFSESEMAEQIVQYIVKQNLHIDHIPSALTVGEQPNQDEVSVDAQVDAAKVGAEFGEEQPLDIETESEPSEKDQNIEITDGDLALDSEDEGDNEELELESDSEESKGGDEKEEGEELELEDSKEANLGEEREVENESEPSTDTTPESNEEPAEDQTGEEKPTEFEETTLEEEPMVETDTDSMSIEDMKFYLRSMGMDPRELADDEIVNLYCELTDKCVAGIDDNDNRIEPSL